MEPMFELADSDMEAVSTVAMAMALATALATVAIRTGMAIDTVSRVHSILMVAATLATAIAVTRARVTGSHRLDTIPVPCYALDHDAFDDPIPVARHPTGRNLRLRRVIG